MNPLHRYHNVFPDIGKMIHKLFEERTDDNDDCPVTKESSAALWAFMASQQVKRFPDGTRRVLHCDSFYTRHAFGRALSQLTEGSMKLTGTIKMNLVDALNKIQILLAKQLLADSPKGTWALVPAFDAVDPSVFFCPVFQQRGRGRRTRRRLTAINHFCYEERGSGAKRSSCKMWGVKTSFASSRKTRDTSS